MFTYLKNRRQAVPLQTGAFFVILSFLATLVVPPSVVQAQQAAPVTTVPGLPLPGSFVPPSPAFEPALIKGLTIFPDNPLRFDFLVDIGDSGLEDEALTIEANRQIKYFLAALTVPEEEMWVNLSPYEGDRIIPETFGQTEMGRDLLAQDYILKQLIASLVYPENGEGQRFWDKVYAKAYELYGTTQIPVNTFNKVWIVPEKATVYTNKDTAFVVEGSLDVMMQEDYFSLDKNVDNKRFGTDRLGAKDVEEVSTLSSEMIREVILPAIKEEVNHGSNFASLRKIYHAMILATWFKKNLFESFLGQVYSEKNKIGGIEVDDPAVKDKIYQQYLKAFETGVYNFIKEEWDEHTQQLLPRKYFSGGFALAGFQRATAGDVADLAGGGLNAFSDMIREVSHETASPEDAAMVGKFGDDVGSHARRVSAHLNAHGAGVDQKLVEDFAMVSRKPSSPRLKLAQTDGEIDLTTIPYATTLYGIIQAGAEGQANQLKRIIGEEGGTIVPRLTTFITDPATNERTALEADAEYSYHTRIEKGADGNPIAKIQKQLRDGRVEDAMQIPIRSEAEKDEYRLPGEQFSFSLYQVESDRYVFEMTQDRGSEQGTRIDLARVFLNDNEVQEIRRGADLVYQHFQQNPDDDHEETVIDVETGVVLAIGPGIEEGHVNHPSMIDRIRNHQAEQIVLLRKRGKTGEVSFSPGIPAQIRSRLAPQTTEILKRTLVQVSQSVQFDQDVETLLAGKNESGHFIFPSRSVGDQSDRIYGAVVVNQGVRKGAVQRIINPSDTLPAEVSEVIARREVSLAMFVEKNDGTFVFGKFLETQNIPAPNQDVQTAFQRRLEEASRQRQAAQAAEEEEAYQRILGHGAEPVDFAEEEVADTTDIIDGNQLYGAMSRQTGLHDVRDLLSQAEKTRVEFRLSEIDETATDQGGRKYQEDFIHKSRLRIRGLEKNSEVIVTFVADGHGGSGVVDVLKQKVGERPNGDIVPFAERTFADAMREARGDIRQALKIFYQKIHEATKDQVAGATLTVQVLSPEEGKVYRARLGDSPAFHMNVDGSVDRGLPEQNARTNSKEREKAFQRGASYEVSVRDRQGRKHKILFTDELEVQAGLIFWSGYSGGYVRDRPQPGEGLEREFETNDPVLANEANRQILFEAGLAVKFEDTRGQTGVVQNNRDFQAALNTGLIHEGKSIVLYKVVEGQKLVYDGQDPQADSYHRRVLLTAGFELQALSVDGFRILFKSEQEVQNAFATGLIDESGEFEVFVKGGGVQLTAALGHAGRDRFLSHEISDDDIEEIDFRPGMVFLTGSDGLLLGQDENGNPLDPLDEMRRLLEAAKKNGTPGVMQDLGNRIQTLQESVRQLTGNKNFIYGADNYSVSATVIEPQEPPSSDAAMTSNDNKGGSADIISLRGRRTVTEAAPVPFLVPPSQRLMRVLRTVKDSAGQSDRIKVKAKGVSVIGDGERMYEISRDGANFIVRISDDVRKRSEKLGESFAGGKADRLDFLLTVSAEEGYASDEYDLELVGDSAPGPLALRYSTPFPRFTEVIEHVLPGKQATETENVVEEPFENELKFSLAGEKHFRLMVTEVGQIVLEETDRDGRRLEGKTPVLLARGTPFSIGSAQIADYVVDEGGSDARVDVETGPKFSRISARHMTLTVTADDAGKNVAKIVDHDSENGTIVSLTHSLSRQAQDIVRLGIQRFSGKEIQFFEDEETKLTRVAFDTEGFPLAIGQNEIDAAKDAKGKLPKGTKVLLVEVHEPKDKSTKGWNFRLKDSERENFYSSSLKRVDEILKGASVDEDFAVLVDQRGEPALPVTLERSGEGIEDAAQLARQKARLNIDGQEVEVTLPFPLHQLTGEKFADIQRRIAVRDGNPVHEVRMHPKTLIASIRGEMDFSNVTDQDVAGLKALLRTKENQGFFPFIKQELTGSSLAERNRTYTDRDYDGTWGYISRAAVESAMERTLRESVASEISSRTREGVTNPRDIKPENIRFFPSQIADILIGGADIELQASDNKHGWENSLTGHTRKFLEELVRDGVLRRDPTGEQGYFYPSQSTLNRIQQQLGDSAALAAPAVSEARGVSPTGGIDLDATLLDLEERGEGIEFRLPPELLNFDPDSITGFSPVIFQIVPVTNLPLLLGLDTKSEEDIEKEKVNQLSS